MSPTKRQLEALRFIRGYQLAKGRTPGLRAIADGLGVAAHSQVHYLLAGLEERELISRRPGAWPYDHRPIEVLTDITIPRSPTGEPLYFVEINP